MYARSSQRVLWVSAFFVLHTHAQFPFDQSDSSYVEGYGGLEWVPIALDFGAVLLVVLLGAFFTRSSVTRPGGTGFRRFGVLLPPTSKEELRRLFMTDIRSVVPSDYEKAVLHGAGADEPFAQSLMCWRRTQLSAAVLCYAVTTVIVFFFDANAGLLNIKVHKDPPYDDDIVEKAALKVRTLGLLPACQALLALAFYVMSSLRWHDMDKSRLLTMMGWSAVFLFPFLFFSLPWLDIDAPQEYVRDLCDQMVGSLISPQENVTITLGGHNLTTHICSYTVPDISSTLMNDVVVQGSDVLWVMVYFFGLVLKFVLYVPFMVASFEVMKALAPGVLGVLFGLQSGVLISKYLFPGVRLTAWLLIILQACTIPVVMFLCAIILVVVGTLPVMFTAICLTASMSLYLAFPQRLVTASTYQETRNVTVWFQRVGWTLKLIGGACLIVGVLMAPHLMALRSQGVSVIADALRPVAIVRMFMAFAAGVFASKVVFVDIIVYIIMSTYLGCHEDSAESREDAMQSILSLSGVFNRYKGKFEDTAVSTYDIGGQTIIILIPKHWSKECEQESEASALRATMDHCHATNLEQPLLEAAVSGLLPDHCSNINGDESEPLNEVITAS